MKSDKYTNSVLFAASLIIILISGGIVFSLLGDAVPVFEKFGWHFIVSTEWNPTEGREAYGALPFIAGTISTSVLALLVCLPMAFATALFIGEYFRRSAFSSALSVLIDLLAGIPSIVYGLWGFYTIRPFVVQLGWDAQGYGIFTAGIVLAIMIIPYATSISAEIIKMVPNEHKEAAYSLGATRLEVIFYVILPTARSGIVASFILAFGRALGETMAVTMLIGNTNIIPTGLFSAGNSMASVIANQFGEADGLKLSALIAIGLLLFVITGIVNAMGKLVIKKLS